MTDQVELQYAVRAYLQQRFYAVLLLTTGSFAVPFYAVIVLMGIDDRSNVPLRDAFPAYWFLMTFSLTLIVYGIYARHAVRKNLPWSNTTTQEIQVAWNSLYLPVPNTSIPLTLEGGCIYCTASCESMFDRDFSVALGKAGVPSGCTGIKLKYKICPECRPSFRWALPALIVGIILIPVSLIIIAAIGSRSTEAGWWFGAASILAVAFLTAAGVARETLLGGWDYLRVKLFPTITITLPVLALTPQTLPAATSPTAVAVPLPMSDTIAEESRFVCPVCNSSYPPFATRCSTCNADLVEMRQTSETASASSVPWDRLEEMTADVPADLSFLTSDMWGIAPPTTPTTPLSPPAGTVKSSPFIVEGVADNAVDETGGTAPSKN